MIFPWRKFESGIRDIVTASQLVQEDIRLHTRLSHEYDEESITRLEVIRQKLSNIDSEAHTLLSELRSVQHNAELAREQKERNAGR